MNSVEVLRMVERLIITLSGCMGLFLGYRLLKGGILNIADAEWQGLGLKLKLSKASPGIFFCMFGTFILVTSLSHEVQYTQSGAEQEPKTEQRSRTQALVKKEFIGLLNDESWDEIISSVNSMIDVIDKYGSAEDITELNMLKTNILAGAFGKEDFIFYQKYSIDDLATIDGATRARWFTLNRRAQKRFAAANVTMK